MKRIAIIGGGISGLSAAFQLEKARAGGRRLEYTLFESGARLGGSMSSDRDRGCLVEAGPDSFLTEKPWAAALCKELGIADQLIGSNDAQRKTYIVVKGRLVAMPDGLMFMVPTKLVPTALSPLFSWGTKLRMARELLHPPRPMQDDETVARAGGASFRRGGRRPARRSAALRRLRRRCGKAERARGAAAVRRDGREIWQPEPCHARAAPQEDGGHAGKQPVRPLFTSLKDGMQQMVDALTARLDPACHSTCASACGAFIPSNGGWRVAIEMGSDERYDAVILATPANVAGALLEASIADLARDLLGVTYSSSVTVTLGYYMDQLRQLPPGFGFLVPRSEGTRMLACTFVHNKFPHRAPADKGYPALLPGRRSR